jgi:DNA (cytosine-5)-methyltransferase 1
MQVAVAVDTSEAALGVYRANFPGANARCALVEELLDGEPGLKATARERRLIDSVGNVDLLVGGPPCQGNSDLNNHTRRDDPKNSLYDRMARFAELIRPRHIIIENVGAVQHDEGCVVDRTIAWLDALGYNVDHGLIDVGALGGPQQRRRHVLIASLLRKPRLARTLENYYRPPRTVAWAINDLRTCDDSSPFHEQARASAENQKRINYLFRYKQYDLPNERRPDCHRLTDHSYKSVYGRMYWNKPAQTITTGFTSMGQGRFVHPLERRTLTPHEAARLQFVPDFFRFASIQSRVALAEMIGNGVPVKLTYVLALDLLR